MCSAAEQLIVGVQWVINLCDRRYLVLLMAHEARTNGFVLIDPVSARRLWQWVGGDLGVCVSGSAMLAELASAQANQPRLAPKIHYGSQ